MRMIIALPLLMLTACQVTEDDANDSVTVEYNQDVLENGVADVVNGVEEAGGAIANGAQEAGATIQNKVENVDVDVDVDTNTADNRG